MPARKRVTGVKNEVRPDAGVETHDGPFLASRRRTELKKVRWWYREKRGAL